MIPDDLRDDPLLRHLAVLPTADVDPAHAARLRSRCHVRLQAARAGRGVDAVWGRFLEPAVLGAASALYLADVVRRAAALFGL